MLRTLVIAEIGSNHMADFSTAVCLLEEAKRAGANAVKFQLYTPTGLAHPTHPSQDTLKRFALPRSWMPTLVEIGRHLGIGVTATPCDLEAVDLLDSLDVPFIKIASGDLTYHKLIRHAAKTGRRVILSMGFATREEVDAAIIAGFSAQRDSDGEVITDRAPWCSQLTLLQCTGAYPAKTEDANLRSMMHWFCPVGLSDHTTDVLLPAFAVAAGATVIEKHLRLRDTPTDSPDYPHSLTPSEFRVMVEYIRMAESAMGDGVKRVLPCEEELRVVARRGLYWANDLPAGHVVQDGDVVAVRCAYRKRSDIEFLAGCLRKAAGGEDTNDFRQNEPIPPVLQPSDEERLLGRALLCDVRQWGACEWREAGL